MRPFLPLMSLESYALILDDHPLVARGMAEFLRATRPDLEVVTLDRVSALEALLQQRGAPRLALVDFWLLEGSALDVVAWLRRHAPAVVVAVVSGDDDPTLLERVRRAGAHGFIHKQSAPDTVAEAVEALLGGLTWFMPPPHPPAAARERELPVTPEALGLSRRQGEILALVLQGLPNKRIAQQFQLSESTVKEHVSAILQRLGARTRVEAITRLRGQRLVLPDTPSP